MEFVGDTGVVVWAEVPLLATDDLPSRDEVKVGGDGGEAFSFEPVLSLVFVGNGGCDFKLLAPGGALGVFSHDPLDKVAGLLPNLRLMLFYHLEITSLRFNDFVKL